MTIKILKNFCSAKDTVNRIEKKVQLERKIFAKHISDKGLVYKICKESLKPNNEKTNNPIKKWSKDLHGYLTKEDVQMINKHMKRYSISYVIIELYVN